MTDVDRWIDKLDAMTANDIATLLREEKVTGYPGHVDRCPIANFLRSKGANVTYLRVSGHSVQWAEGITKVKSVPVVTVNSEPDTLEIAETQETYMGLRITGEGDGDGIREFVRRFDCGEFMDLRTVVTINHNPIYEDLKAKLFTHTYTDHCVVCM